MSSHSNTEVVDAAGPVAKLIDAIMNQPTSPPSLYLDLEGVDLGRHGSLCILQIHVAPIKKTFLVDVHVLQRLAFETPGTSGKTLANVLEDASIPKVIFDIRTDSDALFGLFGIRVAGIIDLQLMELASGRGAYPTRRFLAGLARCIGRDAGMSQAERQAWNASKDKGRALFAPELGGSYQVFTERPLAGEVLDYCVQDVEFLPCLHDLYRERISTWKWEWIQAATKDRIQESQSSEFKGKGRHMAIPPPGWRSLNES